MDDEEEEEEDDEIMMLKMYKNKEKEIVSFIYDFVHLHLMHRRRCG